MRTAAFVQLVVFDFNRKINNNKFFLFLQWKFDHFSFLARMLSNFKFVRNNRIEANDTCSKYSKSVFESVDVVQCEPFSYIRKRFDENH